MTEAQRADLRRIAASTAAAPRKVTQANALLLAADGVPTNEVARRLDTTATSVLAWRRRFEREGVAGVGRIAGGRGRKPWLPAGTVAEIARITREEPPGDGSTHWTARSLARRVGVSKDTVARVWREHGLEPRRTGTTVRRPETRPSPAVPARPAPRRRGAGSCVAGFVKAIAVGVGTWRRVR
jgi:transposase